MKDQHHGMRQFSESFKKEKVRLFEERKVTVLQLCRIYEVSTTSVYKWIRKYSKYAGKHERVVVEKESEGAKTTSLLKKVAELEQLIGQKQVEIEYLKKVIDFGSDYTETDIKKSTNPSSELVYRKQEINGNKNGGTLYNIRDQAPGIF